MSPLAAARPGERGVALIIVVGIVALLSTMVIALQAEVSRTLSRVTQARGTAEARRTAEVGLAAAMVLLQYDWEEDDRHQSRMDYFFRIDDTSALSALGSLAGVREIWSLFAPDGMSPLMALGLPGNFLPLGETGGVEIQIMEESGKWNVHRLHRPAGIRLDDREAKAALQALTLILDDAERARIVLASLIDWLDTDDETVDPAGAEAFYYGTLDPPYMPRNGAIPHIEELRALRGVDEETYALLTSAVTVWPNDLNLFSAYRINVNTAPPDALLFLAEGMDWSLANRMIDERDREPFETAGDLRSFLVDELKQNELAGQVMDHGLVAVQSRAFRIRATGHTLETAAVLEAVVDRDPSSGRMRILQRRWVSL